MIFINKNIVNKLILEQIQRIKLLSKYDSSKTLSEQTIPGGISQQAYNKIMAISAENKKGLRGSYLFPTQQAEINKEFGADTYTKFYRNGGKDVLKGEKTFIKQTQTPTTTTTNTEKVTPTPAKPAAKPVATPPELKNIKAFQDWLDVNAKGWATGYVGGIINKGKNGGGYGTFGKRTQKAWATYKNQYLKGSTTSQPSVDNQPGNDIQIDPTTGRFKDDIFGKNKNFRSNQIKNANQS